MTATELKEYMHKHNKVEMILESIGCHHVIYHQTKGYYSCCNKDGDNPTAINIYDNEYLGYVNYTRGISAEDKQDIISLVQYTLDLDFVCAVKHIHKVLNIPYRFEKKKEVVEEKPDPLAIFKKFATKKKRCNVLDFEPMDEDVLNDFVPMVHVDFFREGIIAKTIKKFHLGYSYYWKRTIIPHFYWMNGQLFGYNSRTSIQNCEEFGIPKYVISPGKNKTINLYGLWENYDSIQKEKRLTIFEAEKSVLRRDSLDDCTCVALSGKTMSEEQVRIILGLNINEVIIALDKDVPIEEVWNVCEHFYRLRKVSYIWDKWDILDKKDSPADANNKMYGFLFENRVVYDESKHKSYLKSLETKHS